MFLMDKAELPLRLNRPLFTQISMNETSRAAKKVNSSNSTRQLNRTRQQHKRLPFLRSKRRSCEFSLQNECSSDYDSYIRSDKYKLSFEPGLRKGNYTAQDLIHLAKSKLVGLRGSYDDTLAMTDKTLSQTSDIRNQITKLRRQFETVGDLNDYLSEQLKTIQSSMQHCQEKQEEATTQKKTLEHVLRRMQTDKIFYEQKGYMLEVEAQNHTKNQNVALKTNLKAESQNYQYQTIYKNIHKDYTKYKDFRAKKLNQFTQTLEKHKEFSDSRVTNRDFMEFKKNQTRQLYLVHNFLERVLKDKAAKLRNDYRPLEVCFDQIRRSVTLSDNDIIADKFFAQSDIFQTVKETVHSLQQKLRSAQSRHEALMSQYQRLSSDLHYPSQPVNQPQVWKLPSVNWCLPQHDYRIQNIYSWALDKTKFFQPIRCNSRMRKQLSIRQSKMQGEQKPHSVEQTAQKFEELCKRVVEFVKASEAIKDHRPKRFSTNGISIKKQLRRMSPDDERDKIAERQMAIEINTSEMDWINRLRKQVKTSRQANSIEHQPRSPYRKVHNR